MQHLKGTVSTHDILSHFTGKYRFKESQKITAIK